MEDESVDAVVGTVQKAGFTEVKQSILMQKMFRTFSRLDLFYFPVFFFAINNWIPPALDR